MIKLKHKLPSPNNQHVQWAHSHAIISLFTRQQAVPDIHVLKAIMTMIFPDNGVEYVVEFVGLLNYYVLNQQTRG